MFSFGLAAQLRHRRGVRRLDESGRVTFRVFEEIESANTAVTLAPDGFCGPTDMEIDSFRGLVVVLANLVRSS
jgi:hypothetical protein